MAEGWLLIVRHLAKGPATVDELGAETGFTKPTILETLVAMEAASGNFGVWHCQGQPPMFALEPLALMSTDDGDIASLLPGAAMDIKQYDDLIVAVLYYDHKILWSKTYRAAKISIEEVPLRAFVDARESDEVMDVLAAFKAIPTILKALAYDGSLSPKMNKLLAEVLSTLFARNRHLAMRFLRRMHQVIAGAVG